MQKIVIFGKGGIGKSTVTANMAVVYAKRGKKVLVVGCDPKHDTTVVLTGGKMIPTIIGSPSFMNGTAGQVSLEEVVVRGKFGIDCVEAGGPEPGVGCAGRGISRMAEILEAGRVIESGKYDVVLFDVLGDVVCGGFAAPLRQGFAQKVVIVTSEELMSLYAANNIARAVQTYLSNGIALLGLVANLRQANGDSPVVRRFARCINTRVLTCLDHDPRLFLKAERLNQTVVEAFPASPNAKKLRQLATDLVRMDASRAAPPRPLRDEEFYELSRKGFVGERAAPPRAAPVSRPPGEPSQAVAPSIPAPGTPQDGLRTFRARLPLDAEGQRSPADSIHSLQWGDPERWRHFFADNEFERNKDAGMRFSGPILSIHHGDIECRFSTPSFDEGLVSFLNLPCVPCFGERVPHEGAGSYRETNLKESDVIGGGMASLDAVLADAKGTGCRMVVVNSTCVPVLIGDDWKMLAERARRRFGLAIHYNAPSAGVELDMPKLLLDLLREDPVFSRTRPKPGVVNLLGFSGTVALEELKELLGKAGIEVNLAAIPFFDYEQARCFPRASVQVLNPSPRYQSHYASIFAGSKARTISPPAPYGIAATRRWLREVCVAAGKSTEEGEAVFQAQWRAVAPEWSRLREAARGHRLAFVLDMGHLRALLGEQGILGVPVLEVLQESGFSLDFLVYRKHGAAVPKSSKNISIQGFESREELARLLRSGGFSAVYSEYFFDERLMAAGKAQFSLPFFSMGVRGAVRTLERLVGLCGWRFYRRYSDYLGGRNEA